MKSFKIAFYALLILLGCGVSGVEAITFDTWHWRNPAPTGLNPNAIACGGGGCVAVGDGGTILTSADGGTTWTPRVSGTASSLAGVAYGGGIFVAVGPYGAAAYSTNGGLTWQAKNASSNYNLLAVASGPLGFVAVGLDNQQYTTAILTLTDPVSASAGWVSQNHDATAGSYSSVACNADTVVAVGANGHIKTWRGAQWQTAASTTAVALYAVAYGAGLFVAAGESGTIVTSSDGLTWGTRASKTTKLLRSVAYGGGVFAAVGLTGVATTSTGGVDWTPRNTQTLNDLIVVTPGGPGLIAAGKYGTLVTSPDGNLWTNPGGEVTGDPQTVHLDGIAHGNGRFVTVGALGTIFVSSDGKVWSRSVSPTSVTLHGVAYGGGHYCTVGINGTILTSSDGVRWTPRNSGTAEELFGVAYGGGKFVAVGKNGVGVVSVDLVNWQVVSTGFVGDLRAVAYGFGRFAAVGIPASGSAPSCHFYTTSADGAVWTPSAAIFPYYSFTGIVHGENGFIAVGQSEKIAGSINGTDWTMSGVSPAYTYMNAIAYGNGWYLGVGANGTIYGPNGIDPQGNSKWMAFPTGASAFLNGVVYANGSFVAVGSGGTILQSDAGNDEGTIYTNIAVSDISDGGAVIRWTSSEPTTTQVEYRKWGTDPFTWQTANGTAGWTTAHEVTMTGLDPDTRYLFKVVGITTGSTTGGTPITLRAREIGFTTLVRKETIQYLLTLKRKGQGTGTLQAPGMTCADTVCTALVDGGTSVTIQAQPGAGSGLLLWSADCRGANASCTLVMDEDRTATAVFATLPPADTPLDRVVWRGVYPQGNDLTDIVYGAGRYVAVGVTGTVIVSTDGLTWKTGYMGTRERIISVAYGRDLFTAVAQSGAILASPDGLTWTIVTETGAPRATGPNIAYGNGRFLVPGYQSGANGTEYLLMTSFDGIEWTASYHGGTHNDITFCGGLFVGVGRISEYAYPPGAAVLVSKDGVAAWWTDRSVITTPASPAIKAAVCSADGLFAIASNGTVFKSSDLISWTIVAPNIVNLNLATVAAGAGLFATVGTDTNGNGKIFMTDASGVWTEIATNIQGALTGIAYGSAGFVAIGGNGALLRSADGTSWQAINPGHTNLSGRVAYGNGVFVIAGSGIHSSSDGISWAATGNGIFYGLNFINGRFLAMGHNSTLFSSLDGRTWTPATGLSWGQSLYGAAYGNGIYILAGGTNSPVVYTSTDGATWTARDFGSQGGSLYPLGFHWITFGDGVFIATGTGYSSTDNRWYNVLFTSTDGVTWTRIASTLLDNAGTFTDILFADGRFFLTGGSGIFVSDNKGATWSSVSQKSCYGIGYGGGVWLATMDGGGLISPNGTTWTEFSLPTGKSLSDAAFGNNTFVITSENGIFQTGPFAGTLVTADVNRDGQVDLADLIIVLQWMTGRNTTVPLSGTAADVNGDFRAGMAEASFILQSVSHLR